jgi:hypothetical protein
MYIEATELSFIGSSRKRLARICQTFGLENITKIAKLNRVTFADRSCCYLFCLLLSQQEAPGVEGEDSVEGGVRHGLEVGGVQQARRLLEIKEYQKGGQIVSVILFSLEGGDRFMEYHYWTIVNTEETGLIVTRLKIPLSAINRLVHKEEKLFL